MKTKIKTPGSESQAIGKGLIGVTGVDSELNYVLDPEWAEFVIARYQIPTTTSSSHFWSRQLGLFLLFLLLGMIPVEQGSFFLKMHMFER